MQITISAEEIFNEYKAQIAELNHELTMERMKSRKLLELVERYELQETIASAQPQNRQRALQTPQERLPVIPAPPDPPNAYNGPIGTSEGTPI